MMVPRAGHHPSSKIRALGVGETPLSRGQSLGFSAQLSHQNGAARLAQAAHATRDCPKPLAVRLEELAARVHCLLPDHRNPEAFHLEKDDIRVELRRLARAVGGQPA